MGHDLLLHMVGRTNNMPTIYAINNVDKGHVFDFELGVDLTKSSNCQALHRTLNVVTLPIGGHLDGMDKLYHLI